MRADAHFSSLGWRGTQTCRGLGREAGSSSRCLCSGWSYPNNCSWASPPSLRISGIDVVLDDAFRPTASVTGGALASGGWKRGWQSVEYAASDRGAGILKAELILGGTSYGYHLPTCAPRGQLGKWTRLQPCPRSVRSPLAANLSSVADGTHRAHVRVTDASGQTTASAPFDVKVDQTAPAGPNGLAIDGGEGWRADPDLTARWENPIEDHAPITAARWRLCPLTGGPCREGRAAAEDITGLRGLRAPGEGEYELSIWLEDAAGNHDVDPKPDGREFALTPPPPALFSTRSIPRIRPGFRCRRSTSSRELPVATSRCAGAAGSAWHALPTTVEGGKLTAFVDDERFEPGAYEFRAFARDRAGNESSTDRRASGATMGLDLPLRIGTRLRAGVARKTGKRTRLRKELSVRLGTRVTVRGSLLADGGQPLDDAELQVFARPSFGGGEERLVGLVRTRKNGRFTYRTRAAASRVLRFRFAGTRRIVGANREVDLQVAAGTTLRASDRTVRVGETVMFSGRLQTRPAPAGGKLVEVQAFFRDQWRTFSTVRTDARGRWTLPLRVQRHGWRGSLRLPRAAALRGRLPVRAGTLAARVGVSTWPVTGTSEGRTGLQIPCDQCGGFAPS